MSEKNPLFAFLRQRCCCLQSPHTGSSVCSIGRKIFCVHTLSGWSLYTNISWMRFTGYFINIAAVFIPLFGLYGAFYLGKAEDYRIDKKWYLLLIPACFLSVMALTNDLHHFLYYIVPEEPQPNLYFHPYIGTYLIYLWGVWMIGHQVYVIYQRNGTTKSDPLYRKMIPFYEPTT